MKIKKIILSLSAVVVLLITVSFQSDLFEIAKQLEIYTDLFKELNMHYYNKINPAKLNEIAIKNMLKNLDPYTNYFDEQGVENARIRAMGAYGGIGITTKLKNKKLIITNVLKNSPAQKENLKVGDELVKLNGIVLDSFSKKEPEILLNGEPGSIIEVTVLRSGISIQKKLIREKIVLNPVPYYAMVNKTVGYITFTKFNEKAASQIKSAIIDLKKQGMKQLIIDERNNPGGLLNEAVKIVNFFIPKNKIVVATRAKTASWSSVFKTRKEPLDSVMPVIVLVNQKSASASEIVAGSLQDYDRAVIIGQRSFGKGLVQRYRALPYGSQMKLTIAKYYTPSGRCIQELDYQNRKENGKVPKYSAQGRKQFKTTNDRIVFGGGGIMPDVKIEQEKLNNITKQFLKSDAFFNFITQYFYQNQTIKNPDKFQLNQSDFNNLIQYLEKHPDEFKIKTEKQLSKLKTDLNKEALNLNFDDVYQKIREQKIEKLKENENFITFILAKEIIKRYYYEEGVSEFVLKNDKDILKAVNLFNNVKNYNKLLSK
ncbi:MAG: S41 family peptidase [Lutibacter sp.]